MKLNIKGNRLLNEMLVTDKRFVLNVGGSRSGKTYAILQYLLIYCFKNKNKVVTIARKTFPSLRAGAMREFIQILKDYELYDEKLHNKTNNIYALNDNIIQFISIDQSIKMRGLKHDIVFVDEINEISKEEADQLFLRTTERIIMAENPSDALHFSLKYVSNPECLYLHSTYVDNPFLEQAIINQIESYKGEDEDMWNVYGLGLPAKNNELVYTHQQYWTDEDELYEIDAEGIKHPKFEEIIYGADWGWNHPTAVVKCWIDTNYKRLWVKEIIHESYLTTDDLITKMNILIEDKECRMYGDSAEPKTIESIRRAGFNITSSNKEVIEGINCIKSYKLYIHSDSSNLQTELRKYKWKMKGEMKTDEPIKLFDDGLCALRYAVYTFTEKTSRNNSYDFDIEIMNF